MNKNYDQNRSIHYFSPKLNLAQHLSIIRSKHIESVIDHSRNCITLTFDIICSMQMHVCKPGFTFVFDRKESSENAK